MAYKLYTLPKVTVTTAGTPVPLTTNNGLAVSSLIITASSGNVGSCFIGDSSVDSTNGEELAAGDSMEISADILRGTNYELFLSSIYVDSEQNGDSVTVQYLKLR